MPRACANCLRLLWLQHIFRHYLTNSTIFGKKLLNIKCVFWFSLQLLFVTFLVVTRSQRHIVINVKKFFCNEPVSGTWILSTNFRQSLKFQISSKSVQLEPSYSMPIHITKPNLEEWLWKKETKQKHLNFGILIIKTASRTQHNSEKYDQVTETLSFYILHISQFYFTMGRF